MNQTLVTATVAGFVLVIDPNNEEGMRERIEYSDMAEMQKRVKVVDQWNRAHYDPSPSKYQCCSTLYSTLYRCDDGGKLVEEEGADVSGNTKVGDTMYKARCACGKTSWWRLNQSREPNPSGMYTCEDCGEKDDDDYGDFNNYDGNQEREY